MKPISFEMLRRLMRGGHRDRDAESSQTFKRSNSFKRASFRKSLHKHDKVTLPNGLVVKTSAVQRKESLSSSEERKDDGYSTDGGETPAVASGSSKNGPKGVISYGQWVAAASAEDEYHKTPTADDSCPSTMSTNRLSSLDSGVRHSMGSCKTYSVESNKRLSLDYRRVIGLDPTHAHPRPDLSRCPETPSRRSVESNFRRSISTETAPAPPTRLKSLLGSPRVAPKHRDHSPSTPSGISAYSVHGTPNRNRVLSQPMSAPSTPGKQIQRVLQHQRPSHTPTHQLRSSLHDKERFCAVHGSPALQRIQRESRNPITSPQLVRSPKPLNRWSAMFSNSIFTRSPARKSQTLQASLHTQLSSENLHHSSVGPILNNPLRKDRLQQSHHQIYQTGFDSPVLMQRSVQSSNNSPAILRSHTVKNTSSGAPVPNCLDSRLGIARAIGGPRPPEDSVLAFGDKNSCLYESPHVFRRSQTPQCSNAPVILRQSSAPSADGDASVFVRSRPLSSPPPGLPPAPNSSHVLSEQPLLNSSQFYPGKLASSSLVSGLPSVSIVGGRSISSDRSSYLNDSHDRPTPPLRTLSAERPWAPSNSRLSVTTWGRPFSLALGCAKGKADLLSPASMTSETSSRSDRRRRGPSLLVGKASWFTRNSPARKSFRVSNKNLKMTLVEFTEEGEEADLPPPPPPRPARLIPPEQYKKLREERKSVDLDEPVFIPPQKRKPSTPVKFPMSLWRKNNPLPEIRTTTHTDLLMPLSQSGGSRNLLDNRNEKTASLMQALLQDQTKERDDDTRDTNSEPGGARFSVTQKHKPKSVPNSTRLNIKLARNPEALLKALGFDSKKKGRKSCTDKNAGAMSEQIITQLLLEQLSSGKVNQNIGGAESSAPEGSLLQVAQGLESCESLSSLVSSVISSRTSNSSRSKRKGKKVRRRKSNRRVPSVPAYPSWKKTAQKGVGATAAAARLENGDITQKGYEKKRTRLLQPYAQKDSGSGGDTGVVSLNDSKASISSELSATATAAANLSASKRRRQHRRVTRNESRYHSEVRQEAVKEALAQYQSRPKNLPLPSKRASVTTARSPEHHHHDSDSEDSDDDSITAGGSLGSGHSSGPSATPDLPPPSRITAPHYSITPPNTNQQQQFSHRHNVPSSSSSADSARSNHLNNPVLLPPPTLHQQIFAAGGSSSSPPPPPSSGGGSGGHRSGGMPQQQHGFLHHGVSSIQQQPLPPVPPHSGGVAVVNGGDDDERRRREMTEVTDLMRNITTYCDPPDVTQSSQPQPQRLGVGASRDDRLAGHYARHPPPSHHTPMLDPENWRGTGRWKVSNKIQQLLNTLKRPKKRPLPEFYVDDEEDLEIAANPKDPNAPKPEGMVMTPAKGETLIIPAGLPRSVEAAVERYGGSSGFKASVATVLDSNNKLSTPLTYGKLLSRSQKMAYNLLSRLGGRGEGSVLPGDRVALIYPNCDPVSFMCALYACLQAGLVPVPIEVPISRRDAGSQQIGFLLGSCGVSVALTSEACFKGLPKNASGEVVGFKGWPKLNWFITDHLQKPPKEWQIPPKAPDDAPAYIEYSTDCDGSVKGVVVNRSALLNHCRSLTSACSYTEGEVAVCVLDFKRDVGLWHSMFCSVFNGMHVIFIPYSVMKVNPASWMHMITKFKASIAIVKSRDLHWGLLATKDHKDISLHSLRLLLVADGANPWSLSSCDQFLSVFQSKGLRPDAICPCAASPQALTVSVRRPGHGGSTAVGRGVLSMQGLSYGVVRVDQENSLTSLTLQDCGQVMPGAQMQVVRVEGPAYICRTDEVGEICVSGDGVGSEYWGLPGKTNHTFRVVPRQPPDDANVSVGQINQSPQPPPAETGGPYYVRTGLLGFLGPGGLVFVCGSRDGLMTVTGRKHNTDDIIATVLAVEPMKFIFRGRIAVFSQRVLRDERICIIAEQRPECSEEESFQWMSRVLQAVDSIHQVGIYCLALVPPNHLPKTPLGGIHLSETKKRFQEGCLHPANVLMCPHACVTNLPKPREVHHDVGPASVMVGNLVQGNRLAMAQGRDIGLMDDEDASRRHPQFIADILKWRASTTENHEILTLLNAKGQVAVSLTCSQLHKKAERVGVLLLEKGHINKGDHVALIYPPGVDLIAAFYGCLYVGAVPVTIRPPHPQNLQSTVNTVRTVVEVSKSVIILSTLSVIKLLKSKEEKFDSGKKWPGILDTDDLPKKRLPSTYRAPTPEMIAFLDFSVSTTGMLAGIKMSHASATALCLSMKVACELYPSRVVALCLDPYCGLGLALWVLSSVYSGHQSILIPPGEVEVNPALWLTAVSQYKVRDTFCSYGVMELCTKGLSSSITALKQRGINLACVRTCIVVAEERPRITLTNSFSKLFNGLGLSPRAVSTSFGCRVNVAVCLQGASSPDPSTVYVDLRSLRHDRVTLVERGAPHSLCLMESGKLLPGVKVVIANPETKGHCSDSHLGEIWVQSNHNSSGYFTVYGDDGSSNDHFNSQLVTGNTGEVYARTGCLGFLKRTESVQADGELHDAVFVVGSLDETVMQRGMRYHPIDIENTVLRCHKKISECAVFSWTNLMVVVVELDGQEYEALDLVPLITSSVVEEHQVIVGVIVVVDPGVVPINSRGEKQRMHLRDGFLADQLDPIYVAYNM
ncbi:disco-interacting protein 2 homolog C isoform X3 [Hyalella azteca]|uniref:Disco-interacting protein 2 homolog C isoform X3 n=1 Tax=Hyalella azteca TaxID=294128 RepID=A0A979FMJ2_HYAAZ|nr:disco-interacting protein 2 homolog C isoform X3 [Hyalella azteca]